MRFSPITAVLLGTCLSAQNYSYMPAGSASAELNYYNDIPLMRPHARVQMFYASSELAATSMVIQELAFRYDGPIPRVGAPGPFTIQRLTLRVGVTSIRQPSAVFAANLDQPLTTVFDQQHSYLPDPGFGMPEPWGGPGGTLVFPCTSPVTVTIPAGSSLVIELSMLGNSNNGRTHALLDVAKATGGILNGSIALSGSGCSVSSSSQAASIHATGVFAPGAALQLEGQNLGSQVPVAVLLGASDQVFGSIPLPLTLPSTNCQLYTSVDFSWSLTTDASGQLPNTDPRSTLAIPALPALNGGVFFLQLAPLVAGANPPYGLALSDKLTVTLGSLTPADRDIWTVADPDRAQGLTGRYVAAEGFALRLRHP